jgi:phosphoribosylaminoimidazole (AIR) synthetase
MMVCVPASAQEKTLKVLTEQGEVAWVIGRIEAQRETHEARVILHLQG